jgi:hypothetical protein
MEQRGLTRRDLEPYIGSRARVTEVLNRKRSLTLPMIRRLHAGFGYSGRGTAELMFAKKMPDRVAGQTLTRCVSEEDEEDTSLTLRVSCARRIDPFEAFTQSTAAAHYG